ncbi:MAG: hypothetical protein OHK0022_27410 [Roseiflexaceae bacterium]
MTTSTDATDDLDLILVEGLRHEAHRPHQPARSWAALRARIATAAVMTPGPTPPHVTFDPALDRYTARVLTTAPAEWYQLKMARVFI